MPHFNVIGSTSSNLQNNEHSSSKWMKIALNYNNKSNADLKSQISKWYVHYIFKISAKKS